ncbi:MAG: hypothetical protein ABIH63_00080 [archaeon]
MICGVGSSGLEGPVSIRRVFQACIFSEGMYVEENSTLYLGKQIETKSHPYFVHINKIKKVEQRSFPLKFVFLDIKPGIGARQTLRGGLEFKVDMGSGKSFELFDISKEEYKILKNYTALQNEQDAK